MRERQTIRERGSREIRGGVAEAPEWSRERMAELAQDVVVLLTGQPQRRQEILGEAFLACEALRREHPLDFARAARRGQLVEWCVPRVRAALRCGDPHAEAPVRVRGGWMGTFVGPDGRDCGEGAGEFAGADPEVQALAERALARAVSLATDEGNATLLRNLGWYRQRLEHRTYDAIARDERRVPATVRTGVARARKFVLRIVHELQHAQPAPLCADAPAELEPLRQLWLDQELEALERELERTREEFGEDPHWLNLRALLAADRGRRDEARSLYERGLVQADEPSVRARLLNNLANLADDGGAPGEARIFWLRASQLAPQSTTPLLNLLAAASVQEDYASAQHFTSQLGELLSSGRLSDREKSYTCRRLRDNPKFAWLRDTEAWRVGPARWIRSTDGSDGRITVRMPRAAVAVVSLMLALFAPGGFAARASEPAAAIALPAAENGSVLEPSSPQRRGGDSMGSPAGRGGSGGD